MWVRDGDAHHDVEAEKHVPNREPVDQETDGHVPATKRGDATNKKQSHSHRHVVSPSNVHELDEKTELAQHPVIGSKHEAPPVGQKVQQREERAVQPSTALLDEPNDRLRDIGVGHRVIQVGQVPLALVFHQDFKAQNAILGQVHVAHERTAETRKRSDHEMANGKCTLPKLYLVTALCSQWKYRSSGFPRIAL